MRVVKQLAIALIFFAFLFGIGYIVYRSIPRPVASCFDSVQNQGEKGVDCGGPCQACVEILPLTRFNVKAIPTVEGFVDLVAEVRNNNLTHGIESFSYTFELYDQTDTLITSKSGITYVLPNSSKFVVEKSVPVEELPVRTAFNFTEPQFTKIEDYIRPRLTTLNITQDDELGFIRVRGSVINQTNFSYDRVEAVVLLRDEVNRIIGVNKQEIRTLLSNETRFFDMRWPYKTPFFRDIETHVETNIFDDANIIRFTQ